ncbi:MAG: P-loop NTPase [Alphaproteobacteria bacterium]|nr:P-loop NTPase [Alphaproteobacteria bacterium]
MTSLKDAFGFPVVTAIGSGKGGTGKTLIAVSLAQALAHTGERVLLCDGDLGLANAALHLGLSHSGDMAAVLSGRTTVEKATVPVAGGAGARGGFDLLAAPAGSGILADAGQQGARQLLISLRMTDYDRVIVDLAAGVDAMMLSLAAGADENLLVMTPDPAALTDTYAFTKRLAKIAIGRRPSLLVNMAVGEQEGRRASGALIASARTFLKLEPDYLGFIPRDPHAMVAVKRQTPLMTLYPQSAAAKAISDIAERLKTRDSAAKSAAKRAQAR